MAICLPLSGSRCPASFFHQQRSSPGCGDARQASGVLAEMMCLAPSSSQIIPQQLKVFNASSSVAKGFSALVQCCAQTVSC